MATKKKVKKVNNKTIDKMLVEAEMLGAVNNKFVQSDDPELIIFLIDMWKSIQRANPETNRHIEMSIIMLFSAISEMYMLAQDRDTRLKQKAQIYKERLAVLKRNEISKAEMISVRRKAMRILLPVGTKIDSIAPTKQLKYFKLKGEIAQINIDIRDINSQIKAIKASSQLKMYEVNVNGQVYNDTTTHLLSKHERIIKLLKEFNLTPSLSPIDKNTGAIKLKNSAANILGKFN